MRISNARKKSIALIVTLAFLMTLFPLALPAFAATSYETLTAPTVEDDTENAELGKVLISIDVLSAGVHKAWISLPSDYDIKSVSVTEATYNDGSGNLRSKVSVTSSAGNSVLLTIDTSTLTTTLRDVEIVLDFEKVDVPAGDSGAIKAVFENISGQLLDGEVVIGYVSGGELKVEVVEDETFSDEGGEVTIRVRETVGGTFNDEDELKLVLPDGFEWASAADYVYGLYGDYGDDAEYFKVTGDGDELVITFDKTPGRSGDETTQKTAIEFKIGIEVADIDEAEYGDVVAKVKGDYDATPDEIVVGTYGDYEVSIEADDPTTVYAGQLEQEIANITIKETIADSLINGRSVILTLPSWAKWGKIDSSYRDSGAAILKDLSFPGRDGRTAKFIVEDDGTSKAEIELEDMEVVLSPDAPEGDLVIEIRGTAGIDAKVKVAEVKKPISVTVDNVPTIVLGKGEQKIGTIEITEADSEMLREDEELVLELPRDIMWADYDVEVVSGDIELGSIRDKDEKLIIEIEDESTEPSTIRITGTVNAYRTVTAGDVKVEVKGLAAIEVHDAEEVKKYYKYDDNDNGDYLRTDGVEAITYDAGDGLFEDVDSIAEVVVANVGTPAEGGISKAVFTIGSTTYTIDGVEQTMDVAPYIKDSRTYLPMRYVGKALGITDQNILWSNKTATFIKGDRVVQVTIGSKTMLVNGAKVEMDVAPEIVNGRTMLPIRWVGVAFGATLSWDNEAKTVTIEQ